MSEQDEALEELKKSIERLTKKIETADRNEIERVEKVRAFHEKLMDKEMTTVVKPAVFDKNAKRRLTPAEVEQGAK